MASNHIEFKENKKRIYFANACDICKKEGVFLLDNLCSDCIENSCTRGKVEGITITRLPNCHCWKSKLWNENLEQKVNTNASEHQLKEKEVNCGGQSNSAHLALVAYTKKLLEESETKSCPICFNRHRRNLYCTSCEFKINTGATPNPEAKIPEFTKTLE